MRLSTCINNKMHSQALAKDTKNAINIGAHSMVTEPMANSRLIRLAAAKMMGMDMRKEKRAAASRL